MGWFGPQVLNMKASILIIEDEVGVVTTLKDRFREEGYTVSIARDGNVGMEMARLRCRHPIRACRARL